MEFKSGDIIKNYDGKEVILWKTYAQQYGGDDNTSWTVRYLDTGSSMSWVVPKEEDFIRHEDESIFDKLDRLRDEITERNSDLSYIKDVILNDRPISSTSVLKLFSMVGFDSSFNRNGEYFILWGNFYSLRPCFKALFLGKYDEMNNAIERVFKYNYMDKYRESFKAFYEKVNGKIH